MSERPVENQAIENATCATAPAESKQRPEYTNDSMAYVIDQYIHSERDRKILKRRFIDDIHLEPLAEEFDLTAKQIRNIIIKHEAVLFKHLK